MKQTFSEEERSPKLHKKMTICFYLQAGGSAGFRRSDGSICHRLPRPTSREREALYPSLHLKIHAITVSGCAPADTCLFGGNAGPRPKDSAVLDWIPGA